MESAFAQRVLEDSAQQSLEDRLIGMVTIAISQLEEVLDDEYEKNDVTKTIQGIKAELAEYNIRIIG